MIVRYNLACALSAQVGDTDMALDLLSRVFETGTNYDVEYAKVDPDLDSLREDPRFQAMIAAAQRRLAASRPGSTTSA